MLFPNEEEEKKTLKTLTSLNKEVRPFFLGDNGIWSFPSVSSLSEYSIWRSLRFSLAIMAFGACGLIVPKYCHRVGNVEIEESRLLGGYGRQGSIQCYPPCILTIILNACVEKGQVLTHYALVSPPNAIQQSYPHDVQNFETHKFWQRL